MGVDVVTGPDLMVSMWMELGPAFRLFENPDSQLGSPQCGGHLLTEHPTMKVLDVYAAILRGFPFEPKLHVNYQEAVVAMRDGLPKMKDLPKEMGGTGEAIPE